MLLPVRVAHTYQRTPVATWALLGINVGAFLLTLGTDFEETRPLVLDTHAFAPHQLLTSMFLHAGWLHLAGNMLFLWVYGRYVEERMGSLRYTAIYLTCGLVGSLCFAVFTGGSCVGASGAISGLLGFVLVGAPWAEVQVLILWGPYGTWTRPLNVAAFWLVGFWILFQVLMAAASWGFISGVAYSAHIGGCLAGAGFALVLRRPAFLGTGWYLDPSPPGGGPEATRRLRRARRATAVHAGEAQFHVEIRSLDGIPSRVAVIRLLMKRKDMEPAVADGLLKRVEGGEPESLTFADEEAAIRFAREARGLGVRATFLDSAPTTPRVQASAPL